MTWLIRNMDDPASTAIQPLAERQPVVAGPIEVRDASQEGVTLLLVEPMGGGIGGRRGGLGQQPAPAGPRDLGGDRPVEPGRDAGAAGLGGDGDPVEVERRVG